MIETVESLRGIPMTTDRDDFWNVCANCSAEYVSADPPPIIEVVSDGGEDSLVSFCGEDCLSEWFGDD